MAVIDVIGDAAKYLGVEVPSAVFSGTSRDVVELAEVANEAASIIADEHDWQLLKRLETVTGDGATKAFALPADFLRMPKAQQLWSSRLETPLTHVLDHNEWLQLQVQAADIILNIWTILGGELLFEPAPATGETVKFYYQSRLWANDGTNNTAAFVADTDTFRLDNRLLKLAIIWVWKAQKGLAYAEDLERFNDALGRRVAEDKGAKMLPIGRARMARGTRLAYPQAITP